MPTTKTQNPRSFRIVGAQQRIDERETPHPRVDRGELGEKLRNWRKINAGSDPFRRVLGPAGGGAPNPYNSLQHIICAVPDGPVNPERIPVTDTSAMARNIKEVARFFGADVVGIAELDPLYVYSHRARGNPATGEKLGDPINLPHRYAICLGFASDYEKFLSNNSRISDADYGLGNIHTIPTTFMLASYIREMGYPAKAHCHSGYEVNPIPLAVNAGVAA